MNSYKKLFDNVVIFTLGNMGSRIISFLLVPLYTYYLTQSEYGTADLLLTTATLLMPIASAAMYEAVLRFTIDKNYKNDAVLTNVLIISIIGYAILLLFFPILYNVIGLKYNMSFLYIIVLLQMINRIIAQYTRGINETKKFAINGMLVSFFTGFFNVIFLVVLKIGLPGYFLSYILAYAFSTIYLIISVKPFRNINLSTSSKHTRKKLLTYSIPLIPNSIMWWLINGSSRYFINWFIGIEANGIFAVSSRIPALINLVSQIFTQAWQMSVFEEINNENSSRFFSRIFDLYSNLLFVVISFIIVILKPLFYIIFSADFFIAWESAPYLLLGTVFAAFSSFFESIYTASKKTKGVFSTSIYGGILSFLLNMLMIPTLGIVGAGLASMLSFLLMFIIRYFDTRKIFAFKIKWKKFLITYMLILLQAFILHMNIGILSEVIITALIFIIVIIINRTIIELVPFIGKKFFNK